MIGSYVSVAIPGRVVEDVFILPENVVRNSNQIYFVKNGKLEKAQVSFLANYDNLPVVAGLDEEAIDVVMGRIGEARIGRTVSIKSENAESQSRGDL